MGRSAIRVINPVPFVSWQAADGVRSIEIHTGEEVGFIGDVLDCYWAHLAGVKIVAEIPPEGAFVFWTSSSEEQDRILKVFTKSGANVVVTDLSVPSVVSASWQRIGTTDYSMHPLLSVAQDGSESK